MIYARGERDRVARTICCPREAARVRRLAKATLTCGDRGGGHTAVVRRSRRARDPTIAEASALSALAHHAMRRGDARDAVIES